MSYGEDYIFERTNELDKYTYPRFKSQELRVTPLENLAPTVIELVPGTGTNISTNTWLFSGSPQLCINLPPLTHQWEFELSCLMF